MLAEFTLYLQTGLEHILDIKGYDHILFVIALCAVYQAADWKKLLYLVTAFTIGHSVTLALATLHLISVESSFVELLIPITILLTCFVNFVQAPNEKVVFSAQTRQNMLVRYVTALFFGFIHGLGFSNFLTSLLGSSQNLALPLFSFNLGLEIGQLLIVLAFLLLAVLANFVQIKRRDWVLVISGLVGGVALKLITERL
jgi:hypothetical protein